MAGEGAAVKTKEQKRAEAKARREKYDALDPWQKLQRIIRRPGSSQREFGRVAMDGPGDGIQFLRPEGVPLPDWATDEEKREAGR